MEKLVFNETNDAIYKLQLNDSDIVLEFDLLDMNLLSRMLKATENLEHIDEKYQKLAEENEKNTNKIEKIKNQIKLDEQYAKEMRENLDSFLGEGMCQKIFGNKERYGQYNRFMGALAPHFEKMNFDVKKAKKQIIEQLKQQEENDVM